MRVLVTGSEGFIGGYVKEELWAQGHDVFPFDIKEGHSPVRTGGQLIQMSHDVRNERAVATAISGVDGIIHLAGILGTPETVDDPLPALDTNIFGTYNVLSQAALQEIPVATVLTGHGPRSHSPYAISKEAAGRLAEMYKKEHGLRVNQVRPVNAYGPRQSTGPVKKILPTFINRALRGEPLEIYGDGEQISDMVWVADVAKVLVSALWDASKGRLHPTVEVGPASPMTVNDIAIDVMNAVVGLRPNGVQEVKYLPMRPGETRYDVHADQASMVPYNIIGSLKPWSEGLAETVRYYRAKMDAEFVAR